MRAIALVFIQEIKQGLVKTVWRREVGNVPDLFQFDELCLRDPFRSSFANCEAGTAAMKHLQRESQRYSFVKLRLRTLCEFYYGH